MNLPPFALTHDVAVALEEQVDLTGPLQIAVNDTWGGFDVLGETAAIRFYQTDAGEGPLHVELFANGPDSLVLHRAEFSADTPCGPVAAFLGHLIVGAL